MRKLLFVAILIYNHILIGQTKSVEYTGVYDSIPLVTVLEDIESKTDFHFYFHRDWLKDKVITISFDNTPIPTVLDKLFQNTVLNYFIDGNKIILLDNIKINEKPRINEFIDEREEIPTVEKGLVFTREYREDQNGNAENILYEIGNRKQYFNGDKVTLAGYILEKDSKRPVEGAFVYIEDPLIGTSSDEDGFYSLSIPNGKQTLLVSSLNMKDTHRNILVLSSGKFDIEMEVDVIALNEVVVDADREINVKSPQMGLTKMSVEDIKLVPVLLGEKDIMKVATTTSGIQSLGEGSAGINIRGGKADQNLFQLDGTPVYNTSHFFGFFSVFNSDALEGMEVYKSGIPAKYGGRLSSIFNIKTKTPETKKFSGTGGIGPVTSRMLFEGPTFKNGPSFILGGRSAYFNYVINNIKDSPLGNNRASFYDIMGKLEYKINDKNNIYISGYHSFDSFQLESDTLLSYTNFSYTNSLLSLNWEHVFNNKLQGYINTGISNYDYHNGYDKLKTQAFNIDFKAQETHTSANLDYFVNDSLIVKFGVEVKGHKINPGKKYPVGNQSLIASDKLALEQGMEFAPYFSANYDLNDRISFYGGMRYSIFNVLGPGTQFVYEKNKERSTINIADTLFFNKNESIKTYHGPEFRFSSRYMLDKNTSIKASYNRTRQNVHLLLNAASIAPTDIWRLSSGNIRPQIADQYSVGYYKNFYGKHTIEASAELYYKKTQDLVDFKVGADLQFNKSIETDMLQGEGKSYGLELSVKKASGWLTGWINYTISRSLIRIDGNTPNEIINNGNFFPTGYDKPHYINSITNYKFTRRYSMTLNLIFSSGVPVTYPVGKWEFKGVDNIFYSERNAFRIPSYIRADIGFNIEGSHKIKKLAHSFWTISVYNVLGRDNVYSIFFKVEEGVLYGYKLTVFPNPIPTITYNFSF